MKRLGGIERGAIAAGNGGGGAKVAMDVKELFGAGVIGLQIGVGDGPRRRYAALVLDDSEVLSPHAKHGRAVHFCLSTYKVGLLRVQVFAIFILPGFFGVISVIEENSGGVPVQFFLGHERTPLQDENVLAGLSQVESQGSTARAGSDNDCVVLSRHNGLRCEEQITFC